MKSSELKDGETYHLEVLCKECGSKLAETDEMSGSEMRSDWTRLMLSAPLVTRQCPNGCRSTFSDCNINTDIEIVETQPATPNNSDR